MFGIQMKNSQVVFYLNNKKFPTEGNICGAGKKKNKQKITPTKGLTKEIT